MAEHESRAFHVNRPQEEDNPGARRIIEILGQYDIAVEAEAGNREKMEELIARICALDGIDKISTYLISKEILP